MRQSSILMLTALLALQPGEAAAACTCGPDFCQDDARIPKLLAAKKAYLLKEFPKNYVDLLDKGSKRVAKIQQAPDGVNFLIVDAAGNKTTMVWDESNESVLSSELASGKIKRFWIFNARRSLSCCGEPNYDAMSDYDATDDINTTQAIKCVKNGGC